jgi:hypothetical protein
MKGQFMGEQSMDVGEKLSREREREFISTTYIDLTRHGNRFGGPIKVTLNKLEGELVDVDDKQGLTPRGRKNSETFGEESYQDSVLVHPRGGDELRHGQSGEDILQGSGKFGDARDTAAPIFSRKRPLEAGETKPVPKLKGARMGQGVDYTSSGVMDVLKGAKKLINDTLQTLVDGLSREEQEHFKTDPEYRAQLREQAQVVGLKSVLESPKPELQTAVKTLAENEALELMHTVELSRRGVKDEKLKAVPIVGSGLFTESLLKHALVVEDIETGEKKIGFDSVDQVGGFTKQASAFRIKLTRDNSKGDARNLDDFEKDTVMECEIIGDSERQRLFEGKKVYFDWGKVKELAQAAEVRLNKKN